MAAMGESPRSPEAKVGMRVEDLWDVMEPELSPTEKLNACFESILVSAFPPVSSKIGIINRYVYIYYTYTYTQHACDCLCDCVCVTVDIGERPVICNGHRQILRIIQVIS